MADEAPTPVPDDATTSPRIERLAHRIPDFAVMLDVSVRSVQRMIASGQLKTIRIAARTVRVTDESVRALFEAASHEAPKTTQK